MLDCIKVIYCGIEMENNSPKDTFLFLWICSHYDQAFWNTNGIYLLQIKEVRETLKHRPTQVRKKKMKQHQGSTLTKKSLAEQD